MERLTTFRPDQINLLLHGFTWSSFCEKIINAHAQCQPFMKYCRISTLPHATEKDKLTGHYWQLFAYTLDSL